MGPLCNYLISEALFFQAVKIFLFLSTLCLLNCAIQELVLLALVLLVLFDFLFQ